MVISSKRTYTNTPCLPGLLLPVPWPHGKPLLQSSVWARDSCLTLSTSMCCCLGLRYLSSLSFPDLIIQSVFQSHVQSHFLYKILLKARDVSYTSVYSSCLTNSLKRIRHSVNVLKLIKLRRNDNWVLKLADFGGSNIDKGLKWGRYYTGRPNW